MFARRLLQILLLLGPIAFAGCQTGYQAQSFTGGYSEFLTAPDEAVITYHGNGFTSGERVVEMAALRCAEVTLAHGYRGLSESLIAASVGTRKRVSDW